MATPALAPGLPSRWVGVRRWVLRPQVLIPAAVVVAAATLLVLRASHSSSTPTVVERTVAVTQGTMRETVSASGTLDPAATDNLSFAAAGQVTAVNVKAGDHVTKAQVLATIDSAPLQSQVTQARATVDSASARLSGDESGGASSAQIASDRANLAAAQAQLASAQASLSASSLTSPIDGTVSIVNLTVGEQLSNAGTGGTNVSGTGTGSGRTASGANSAANGSNSSSNSSGSNASSSPQVQVIDNSAYVVSLNVDDTQIGQIAAGQTATITPSTATGGTGRGNGRFGGGGFFIGGAGGGGGGLFGGGGGGFGGGGGGGANNSTGNASQNNDAQAAAGALAQPTATATGTVKSVGAIATNTSGVATFPVVVAVDGTPTGFYAGSTVQVAITYNQLDNVLQVPTLAITRSNGQAYVTLVQNGKRVQRAVATGATSGGETQITDGLQRGDLVLVRITTQPRSQTARVRAGG